MKAILFIILMLFTIASTLRQYSRVIRENRSLLLDSRTLHTAPSLPSGVFAVYKPVGWTSNDVVQKIKNILRKGCSQQNGISIKKLKVGHGGTLDPIAEGVLVVGVGEGTKLMQDYLSGSKIYHAVGKLGSATDTLDCTGEIVETKSFEHVNTDLLLSALPKFRGDILQIPPMYSAIKQNGKRLYDLARQGTVVTREPRPVTVYALETIPDKEYGPPSYISLKVECSGGFYVRTLIQDVAVEMNTVGHMIKLVRAKQGDFTLDDCLKENEWTYEKMVEKLFQFSQHKAL